MEVENREKNGNITAAAGDILNEPVITGVRGAPTYAENPFLEGASTTIKGRKKHYSVTGGRALPMIDQHGTVLGGVEHKIVRMVDDAQFVKVFADGISGIYDLKSAGSKVFRYLFDVVQKHPNTDRIYLYFMNAAEEPWSIPKSTFFRGLAELLEKKFAARSSDPNMFYLNPTMIWNGDRFRFVTEFVRDKRALSTEKKSKPALIRVNTDDGQQQLDV